jgi:hypothetical protein
MKAKPKRDPFFAHRLVRLLFKTCATLEIGEQAVLLIIHIAHTEDAIRYSKPVSFWNSQLDSVLGFRSPKQLNAARQRAIDAGWLHYERKNDRQVGCYWTDIPNRFEAISDLPIEDPCFPNSERETESIPITLSENGKHSGTHSGKHSGTHSGKPSIPIPIPIPIPIQSERTAKRFISPSAQEIQEYAIAAGLTIDADRFVDFYEAKGWMVGKNKMKDWQAAARNWARQNWARNTTPETLKTNQRQREYVN